MILKLIVVLSSLSFLFLLEHYWPLFKGRKHHFKHAFPNLLIAVTNGIVIAVFFSGLTIAVIEWAKVHEFGLLRLVSLPTWMNFVLAFVLFDLWMYLWHVLLHKGPLWRLHRMHHSDTEMDTTTALRFHPIEIVISTTARLAVLPLLGLDLIHLVVYEMCLQPVIFFHHSNWSLPEKIDSILRLFIVTPNMHRVHHSQILKETNSNYSSILSIWDRVFGSFIHRKDVLAIDYGIGYFEGAKWQKFWGMLKIPFVLSLKRRQ